MTMRNVLLMITPHSQPRLEGVAKFAREHGWNLMMSDRLGDDDDPRAYDGVLTTLRDRPSAVRAVERLLRRGVAVVDLTIECPKIPLPRVVADHAEMGRVAARHFAERGFSNFAWYSSGWTNVHALRFGGFASALPPGPGPLKFRSKGLARAVASAPKPLAVLAYNDADAARFVAACRMAGCNVPRDVAVLGIGNDPFLCENQATPISSVEQDLFRNAYDGAALLERLMSMGAEERAAASLAPPALLPGGGVAERESSDTLAHADADVRNALVWIHTHLSRPFGARAVAKGVGLPRGRLDRLFAAALHESVGDEILKQRLARVKRLLAGKPLPIGRIAEACGFCNSAYLSNSFHRETGLSPSAWRRLTLAGDVARIEEAYQRRPKPPKRRRSTSEKEGGEPPGVVQAAEPAATAQRAASEAEAPSE